MITSILFFLKFALITLFGIILAFAFSGVRFTRKAVISIVALFLFCGLIELYIYLRFGFVTTQNYYPLFVHLPILLTLVLGYRKRILTAVASIATAYMIYQPANWFGLFMGTLTGLEAIEYLTYILVLVLFGLVSLFKVTPYLEELYNKDNRSILIFSIIPLVYYVFDYMLNFFKSLVEMHNQLVLEFLPFIMSFAFLVFCIVYYKEYEKSADAERREQLIHIAVEQQQKEMQAIKQINMESRIIRHDLRFLLTTLATSIENDDKITSKKLLSDYAELVETTFVKRYCENDIINYIITNFENKCIESNTEFDAQVELYGLEKLGKDELLFASIVSNSLDNALNAQLLMPPEKRRVELLIKTSRDRLLVSVKNPFAKAPKFVNGMPVSERKGHGYGTQSIRYLTERLDGNCMFSVQDNMFITRVII